MMTLFSFTLDQLRTPPVDKTTQAGVCFGVTRKTNEDHRREEAHTWRGSDAEAAREVILEGTEDGRHVGLDFIQTDDVFHQSGIKIHLRRLALCLGLGRHKEEKWGGGGEEKKINRI